MLDEKGGHFSRDEHLLQGPESTDSLRLLPTTRELHLAHYRTRAADTSTAAEGQSELYMQRPHQTIQSWKRTFYTLLCQVGKPWFMTGVLQIWLSWSSVLWEIQG